MLQTLSPPARGSLKVPDPFAMWDYSGDSGMKKVGDHCEAKEKVGGQHKCRSCMVSFHFFKD